MGKKKGLVGTGYHGTSHRIDKLVPLMHKSKIRGSGGKMYDVEPPTSSARQVKKKRHKKKIRQMPMVIDDNAGE